VAVLPELSESTQRKLEIQWNTLRDKQKLTEEDLSGYDLGRQWLLGIVAKPPRDMNLGGLNTSQPKRAARWLGLDPSVRVAKARFRGIDSEYWSRWCSSGFGYEVYRDWLDSVMRQISAELATIWKGKSDVTDRWFQCTCGPAVEKALSALVKQRIAQARDVESKRLERAPSSNPILDEIRTSGDNLSPAAQRAIALSGVSPTAVAPRPLGPGESVAPEGAPRGPVTTDAKSDDGRPESAVLPARVVAPAGSVPDSAPVLSFHEVLNQTSHEVARALEGADLSQLSVMAQEAARAFEGADLSRLSEAYQTTIDVTSQAFAGIGTEQLVPGAFGATEQASQVLQDLRPVEVTSAIQPSAVAAAQNVTPVGAASAEGQAEPQPKLRKKRGRKRIFTQDQLDKANTMKQARKSNNEIAKVLYGTLTPTGAQRRSVPTTLNYHFKSNK